MAAEGADGVLSLIPSSFALLAPETTDFSNKDEDDWQVGFN